MGCQSVRNKAPEPLITKMMGTETQGFSAVYRKIGVQQLQYSPVPNVQSVLDLYNHSVKTYPNRLAIGQVVVTKSKDSEGKDVEERTLNNMTYRELYNNGLNLGRAIIKKNLEFQESVHGMRFVGIYAKNRYEWLVTDWACVLFGITSVPLYDTLGVENLTYCLKQTEMKTLFVSAQTAKVLLKLEDIGKLKNLVVYDDLDSETQKQLERRGLDIHPFSVLVKEGQGLSDIDNSKVKSKPDDCYTFSYTSGTTGPPKGAMLSHKNVLAFARSMQMNKDVVVYPEDVYVSYLPLPHSMERCISISLFAFGAHMICSCGDITKLKDDCQIIKPSVLLSVPRLFNKIVETLKGRFADQGGIKGWLANKAVASKLEQIQQNGSYKSTVYDSLVFSKVRDGFGGNVRIMASGSAPLSPQTHEFMMAVMCCPLIEGYGQTESSAGVMYSSLDDPTHGQFAELAETVEVKTCDIPQMKYRATDRITDNQDKYKEHESPRGQLWVRGPHVFLGYYKQPELTKQAITQDGWLKTGDVIQIMPPNHAFKIIDRKKNIFKLQQGEYVAPEKVEHIYAKNSHEYLNPSEIFLHGDSTQNFTVLIVTPHKNNLLKFAEEKGFKQPYEQLIVSSGFKVAILKDLNGLGKKQGLHSFEMAKNLYFEPEGFLDKGILTNTMKLIRFQAKQYYKPQIMTMYKEGDIIISSK